MESEKKNRRRERARNKIFAFFRTYGKTAGIILVCVLLAASLSLYIILQKRDGFPAPRRTGKSGSSDRLLQEAIYHYRLEQDDRALLIFENILQNTNNKKIASLSALYCGNIHFRRADYLSALSCYDRASELRRKNIHALHNAAVSSLKTGDWRRAVDLSYDALDIDGNFKPTLLLLGNIHYGTGNFDEAEKLYAACGEDGLARYNHAQLSARMGGTEAGELFSSLSRDRGGDALGGIAFYQLGMLGEAERPLEYHLKSLDYFPGSLSLRMNAAVLLLREGAYIRAADILNTVHPPFGEEDRYGLILSFALYRSGRFHELLQLAQRYSKRSGSSRFIGILGDTYLKIGDNARAETAYLEVIERTTEPYGVQSVYENLTKIYMERGDLLRAAEICGRYEEAYPGDLGPLLCRAEMDFRTGNTEGGREALVIAGKEAAETRDIIRIARLYRNHGMHNNALALYHSRLDSVPGDSAIQYGIASLYMETGHKERACGILLRVRDDAGDLSLYYDASLLLALNENEAEAQALYHALINDFPYRYEAFYNLALSLMYAGRFDAALEVVLQCFEEVPRLPDDVRSVLYTAEGICRFRLGDGPGAVGSFRAALDSDPENTPARLNFEIVRSYLETS